MTFTIVVYACNNKYNLSWFRPPGPSTHHCWRSKPKGQFPRLIPLPDQPTIHSSGHHKSVHCSQGIPFGGPASWHIKCEHYRFDLPPFPALLPQVYRSSPRNPTPKTRRSHGIRCIWPSVLLGNLKVSKYLPNPTAPV